METVLQKHRRYVAGDFSTVEAVKKYLHIIKENHHLNAFTQVYSNAAQIKAEEIDQKRAEGKPPGKLAGLVIALKDNICMKDQRVTCGSRILDNFVSPYDATVVKKILADDGIIIGKTNMDEFAMGSSSENSYYGPVKNPVDPVRVAGGSSGGSAVAVAANMADLALGSDTGGSVRQPAAFCGVVGLKPTYGRVSRYGLVAFASSLDQIGPFGKSVADAAWMLSAIAGVDANDSTSMDVPLPDFQASIGKNVAGLKIGLPNAFFQEGLDPEIATAIYGIRDELEKRGAKIKQVDLPLNEYAIAAYYIISGAEASSNLARYDGVRYGYRAADAESLHDMYAKSRTEGFGKEVKRRIMLGTHVLSSGYYDAYYKKAQQVRRLIKSQFDMLLKEVDILLTPTTPSPAFIQGEKLDNPLQMYLSDIYTVNANLTGHCAKNVPAGETKAGLPIGVQLIGGAFKEARLFQVGSEIERIITGE